MPNDKTAIFIDGAFFIKRALAIFGPLNADELAKKLWTYSLYHIYPGLRNNDKNKTQAQKQAQKEKDFEFALNHLYRIFFYDCPPLQKKMHHPHTKMAIDFAKSDRSIWRIDFHEALKKKRKVALRLGTLDDINLSWTITPSKIKDLYNKKITIDDLTEKDYTLITKQKGVDMRIGLDIASIAYKKQANKIVLISGDSDFVPAAKLARREGIDFTLDSMHAIIKDDLHEHIDGKFSPFPKPNKN